MGGGGGSICESSLIRYLTANLIKRYSHRNIFDLSFMLVTCNAHRKHYGRNVNFRKRCHILSERLLFKVSSNGSNDQWHFVRTTYEVPGKGRKDSKQIAFQDK